MNTRSIPTIIFFLSLLWLSCSRLSHDPGAPQRLRCEYRINPVGVDIQKPRLSWDVNDSRPDARQTAYQILVASRRDFLQHDKGDIWDSGKVNSNQSHLVTCEGPDLQSRSIYYWKVRTWDARDKVSPFSESAAWEMALLKPADWQALWIGKTEQPQPDDWPWKSWIWHSSENGANDTLFFRKIFKLDARPIHKAVLRLVTNRGFILYINDSKLFSAVNHAYDMESYLRTGNNLIAISTTNGNNTKADLLVTLKIDYMDGSSAIIATDETWLSSSVEEKGWMTLAFHSNHWSACRIIENYGGPVRRVVPPAYHPPRSVMVRKEFRADKSIKRARLYATGLGGYVMFLNGIRVGKDVLTPGWTDYDTRIQYQTYDVTSMLREGDNAMGAILGNAWWSSGLGWRGTEVYAAGPLQLFAQLVIEYNDGSSQIVASDGSWKVKESPILENSLYHGEIYDAQLEIQGWDQPGLNDADWHAVTVFKNKNARLVAQQDAPIQATQELHPVQIMEVKPGVFIFDLGQNMVGSVRLQVSGEKGTKIRLRFGELLNADSTLHTENLRTARATDTYFLKGEGLEIWQPLFTYHGFRYVEMNGYPGKPGKNAIAGIVFHSAAPTTGQFACSNPLLNQILQNIMWGQRGNIMSVPTDCPQRDERLGWMGDAQIFAPTACYNMNMALFFTKWMHDITDCQDADGAVHDVSPTIVVSGPAAPGWGDAVVIIPWVVYQFYGDKRIIEENYHSMAAWVEYMNSNSKDYLYERDGYGDWIAVVASPKLPIAAAYFYYDTMLLSHMAEIIGKSTDAEKYRMLGQEIGRAFQEKYFDPVTNQYPGATQTANLLPLVFKITPDSVKSAVAENIVQDVMARDFHPSTGFLGTAYLLPILSDHGFHSIAYKVAARNTYPSWGYMVEKGATTMWELWNSDTQGPGMNSRNHFALGCIGTWYFEYLAGIRPDPVMPGFQHILLSPKPAGDLTWVEASLITEYGAIHCRWEKQKQSLNYQVSIPANTSATLSLPVSGIMHPVITENGRFIFKKGQSAGEIQGIKFIRQDKQSVVFELGAGRYRFRVMDAF